VSTFRVESLVAVDGKKTVCVRVGDREYEIATRAAQELDLAVGQTLLTDQLNAIEAAADRRAAAAQALKYLRGRPRSEAEVSAHLGAKGHAPEAVVAVLETLRRDGVVDDRRFAQWFVRARLAHRPTGAARLVHELRARGIPDAMARDAVTPAVSGAGEMDLALRAARGRLRALRGLGRERALRRLSHFLHRRGFADETVRRVCLEAIDPSVFGARDDSGHEAEDESPDG
jgi:regulatory protein